MVGHLLFVFSFGAATWGAFEHLLQLQSYRLEEGWNWFWGTQVTWLPHHQWIGMIGIFLGYIGLSWRDYLEAAIKAKKFISNKIQLSKR
jgi:hypothetical protein